MASKGKSKRKAEDTKPPEPASEQKPEAEQDSDASGEKREPSPSAEAKSKHPYMAAFDIVTAILLLGGIWVALPARWWPVDLFGTLMAMGFASAGLGLLSAQPWGEKAGRIVSGVALAAGSVLVLALTFTAGTISGLYGPVGSGGALLLTAVAALLLPYLVVFPAAQLYFLLKPQS